MKKRALVALSAALLAVLMAALFCCMARGKRALPDEPERLTEVTQAEDEQNLYPDGVYRGFYYDEGIEQIAVQFELYDNAFRSIVFRGVKYKDGDYLRRDASDAQKAVLLQYEQMANYLIGKTPESIVDLHSPYEIVEDVDAVTMATIQSSKLISALWDGLNRRPFMMVDTSKLPKAETYEDGVYRGTYMEGGQEQISLEFRIRDNRFEEMAFRTLQYEGEDYLSADASAAQKAIASQFGALIDYLVGREIAGVSDLYRPGEIVPDVDGFSGATISASKVISAVWDGLGRHAYMIE